MSNYWLYTMSSSAAFSWLQPGQSRCQGFETISSPNDPGLLSTLPRTPHVSPQGHQPLPQQQYSRTGLPSPSLGHPQCLVPRLRWVRGWVVGWALATGP